MIFVRGARQLLTLRGPAPRRGMQLCDLGMIPDGSVLIDGEKIHQVGSTRRIENLAAARSAKVIDAKGKVVLPGFVDSHTRPLFPASPLRELETRALEGSAGRPWPDAKTPAAFLQTMSTKVLRLRTRRWAGHLAAHGTTTIDTRSGWALSLQSEFKSLRLNRLIDQDLLDVVSTCLAAKPAAGHVHAGDAVERVTEVLLPFVSRRKLAVFCDVECDPTAFSVEQCRQILERARQLGLRLKLQSDRTAHSGGVGLAVAMKAASVDHLQFIDQDDIDLLAASDTVATLLPGLVYYRGGKRFAPARKLLDRGAAVALATGFGPGYCPALSMPLVLFLACTCMQMLPEETISAATINGAASMQLTHLVGSLEPGKQADLAMYDVADYREIPYYFGGNLCVMTMKKGRVIYQAPGPGAAPPERPAGRQDRAQADPRFPVIRPAGGGWATDPSGAHPV
jgi:imidazolonepropionase